MKRTIEWFYSMSNTFEATALITSKASQKQMYCMESGQIRFEKHQNLDKTVESIFHRQSQVHRPKTSVLPSRQNIAATFS